MHKQAFFSERYRGCIFSEISTELKSVFSNLQAEIPTSSCDYLVKNFYLKLSGLACPIELSAAIDIICICPIQYSSL